MVIDPGVRGKINILAPQPVTTEEAFNLLASALAQNGFSYSLQGDTMYIASARNLQRNFREVVTELPPMKPERMVTWIVTLKHALAEDVNKSMRILPTKDGEIDKPRTHSAKTVAKGKKTETEN